MLQREGSDAPLYWQWRSGGASAPRARLDHCPRTSSKLLGIRGNYYDEKTAVFRGLLAAGAASAATASRRRPPRRSRPPIRPSCSACARASSISTSRPTAAASSILQPGPGRDDDRLSSTTSPAAARRAWCARIDGDPERLRWCNFATNDRLVCQIVGDDATCDGILMPFSRLISLDHERPESDSCSASAARSTTRGSASIDGSILDWLAARPRTRC